MSGSTKDHASVVRHSTGNITAPVTERTRPRRNHEVYEDFREKRLSAPESLLEMLSSATKDIYALFGNSSGLPVEEAKVTPAAEPAGRPQRRETLAVPSMLRTMSASGRGASYHAFPSPIPEEDHDPHPNALSVSWSSSTWPQPASNTSSFINNHRSGSGGFFSGVAQFRDSEEAGPKRPPKKRKGWTYGVNYDESIHSGETTEGDDDEADRDDFSDKASRSEDDEYQRQSILDDRDSSSEDSDVDAPELNFRDPGAANLASNLLYRTTTSQTSTVRPVVFKRASTTVITPVETGSSPLDIRRFQSLREISSQQLGSTSEPRKGLQTKPQSASPPALSVSTTQSPTSPTFSSFNFSQWIQDPTRTPKPAGSSTSLADQSPLTPAPSPPSLPLNSNDATSAGYTSLQEAAQTSPMSSTYRPLPQRASTSNLGFGSERERRDARHVSKRASSQTIGSIASDSNTDSLNRKRQIPIAFYKNGVHITVGNPLDSHAPAGRGNDKNLGVVILNGNYTLYTITVKLLRADIPEYKNQFTGSLFVYRRYREFRALYTTLQKMFKSVSGWPDFPKKSFFDRFSSKTISHRIASFSSILNFIALHPVLYNSCPMLNFLGLAGPNRDAMFVLDSHEQRVGPGGGVVLLEQRGPPANALNRLPPTNNTRPAVTGLGMRASTGANFSDWMNRFRADEEFSDPDEEEGFGFSSAGPFNNFNYSWATEYPSQDINSAHYDILPVDRSDRGGRSRRMSNPI
ncbi:hypothetical protein BJ742DRAFT_825334 [Cladochytrium replicatum]|nr:hypothetical protein BJ742DRAFT_825334 [Cladochytrium replicatum]